MVVCKKKGVLESDVENEASQIIGYLWAIWGGIWRSEAILMHACDQHKLANQILISGLVRFLHASFLFLSFLLNHPADHAIF